MDAIKNIKRGIQEIRPPVGIGPEGEGEGREGKGEGDVRGNGGEGVGEVREDGADSLIEGGCVVREDDGVREVREDGREEGDGVAREHGLVRNDGAYNGRMVCVLICSKGPWIRQHRPTFHQLQSRFVVLTILWLGIRMKIAEKGSE